MSSSSNSSHNSSSSEEDDSILQSSGDSSSDDSASSSGEKVLDPINFSILPLSPAGDTPACTDNFPLPHGDTPWCWEPDSPDFIIQTMTDYTLACRKAVKKIWPNAEFTFGMCSYHAWNAWVKKHRGKFKKYDKNKKRMGEDFEAYKRSPWIQLVPILRDLMIFKWINTYKEKKVATAWLKQWGPTIHTRIELNSSNLLRGGLPAHNNNSEGINSGDKSFFDHRKPLTANFIHNMSYMLEDCSKGDLSFCSTLHSSVHSINFYKSIYKLLEKSQNGEATFLKLIFDFKCDAIRIGEGSLLIATSSFVDLNIMSSMQTMQSQNTATALSQHSQLSQSRKRYLYIGNTESVTALTVMQLIKKNKMHDDYKRLLRNPEQYSANHTFDDVLSLTRRLHLIEPIV